MDFILSHIEIFVALFCLVAETILLLVFKRRPTYIDNSILYKVFEWVMFAEKKFKVGSDKLNYVLSEAEKYLGDTYNRAAVTALVEFVLSSPQKKGLRK